MFLHASLAIYGVNLAIDYLPTIEAVVDAFVEKLTVTILKTIASDDDFQEQYTNRVASCFELLRSGGDAIGVAGDFIVNLFGTPDSRLRLEPILKFSTTVAVSQRSLQIIFEQLHVSETC